MSVVFKSFRKNKWRYIIIFIVGVYAIAGFFLTTVFFAVRMGLTKDPGAVDFNDRHFAHVNSLTDSLQDIKNTDNADRVVLFQRLALLSKYYPLNVQQVLDVFMRSDDPRLAIMMLEAADLYLESVPEYVSDENAFVENISKIRKVECDSSLYHWANTIEWKTLSEAVKKDKKLIDSISGITGVSSRLITSMLIGEQIRLFDSKREAFKKWISPLKILVNETTLSLGVMGIKEETAIKIEKNLKNPGSPFYSGKEFENLLDFCSTDYAGERYQRLTNPKDHTYPYLYCALYLKQVMNQWKASGYDISSKVGILATLYNLGFEVSVPKPDPKVGGSRIKVRDVEYTFGRLAYEYYYSGEMSSEFPL